MPVRGFIVKYSFHKSLCGSAHIFFLIPHLEVLQLTRCYFTNQPWDSIQEHEKGTSLVRIYRKIQDFWALLKFWEFKGIETNYSI